jgi:eukaryotic-like serine/threonine-protein kinase
VPLSAGTKLGPYEIVTAIGSGGMGEVYRAKDNRLDRTVAIKVLPSKFSGKEDLKQRFEREARAISNLSHPHICTLHDIGHQDGIDYVVMEFLEGQTLAQRLTKGALPTEQALQIGIQIADALDKAHKKGIIHRDLKPGNIMLTKSGAKLLDFGLAKYQPASSKDFMYGDSELPTEEKHLTEEGYIVGTLHYMAPEQLEGKNVDSRSDIFAFGTTFYEMLTGKKAFTGNSKANLIVSILEKEPRPISEIQPMTPPALDRTIRTCLAKDPDDRWQSVHDVKSELKWIAESGSQLPVITKSKTRERIAWILMTLLLIATLSSLFASLRKQPQSPPVTRSTIFPPAGSNFTDVALSPDGTKLAFVAVNQAQVAHLYVQSVDSLEPKDLVNLGQRNFNSIGGPFWAPDSSTVAFFSDSKLKKVAATGGPVLIICDAIDPKGGSWGSNGVIVFAPSGTDGLWTVSSDGGTPTPLTHKDSKNEGFQVYPSFLSDGRHFLFGQLADPKDTGIFLGSLHSTEKKFLFNNKYSWASLFVKNNLLYVQDGNLMAQSFNPKTFALRPDARVLQQNVENSTGFWCEACFSAAENGTLVTMTKPPDDLDHLIWMDRQGKQSGEIPNIDNVSGILFSNDGQKVLLDRIDFRTQRHDLWVHDIARGSTSRITFHPQAWFPHLAWSFDDKWVYFSTGTKIFRKLSNGVGEEKVVYQSAGADNVVRPNFVSPNGKFLLFSEVDHVRKSDLMVLSLLGIQKPSPFLQTEFVERNASLSPDGKWVAFDSDNSGGYEVYLRPFEHPDQTELQVSTAGGISPSWRNDGKELIFLAPPGSPNTIMAVDVKSGPAGLNLGIPHPLFSLPQRWQNFDPLPHFERFLITVKTGEEQTSLPLTLITNWPAILQQ